MERVTYSGIPVFSQMLIWEHFQCLTAYLPLPTIFPYLLHTCVVAEFHLPLNPRGNTSDIIGNDPMIHNVGSSIQPRMIFNFEQRGWNIVLETLVAWSASETQQGSMNRLGEILALEEHGEAGLPPYLWAPNTILPRHRLLILHHRYQSQSLQEMV